MNYLNRKYSVYVRNVLGLLFLMLSLCNGQKVYAQQTASTILDRAVDTFAKNNGVKISFTLQSDSDTSEGELCLKGQRFFLDSSGMKTWYDGKTQWSYVANTQEVTVSTPDADELQYINPYAWLAVYKQGYRMALGEKSQYKGKAVYELLLEAKNTEEEVEFVTLVVDRQTYRVYSILMKQRSGESLHILANNYQDNLNYPDSYFVFDANRYQGAEVIDLRD